MVWICLIIYFVFILVRSNPKIKRKKEEFNGQVLSMKKRKGALLSELESIQMELIDIQYRLDPAKRKPVPTIPFIYPEEVQKDPFEVLMIINIIHILDSHIDVTGSLHFITRI